MSPAYLAHLASNRKYVTPPWIEHLEDKVLQVMAGEIKRLIITVPPRHGKSMYISHHLPANWLMNFPNHQVMLAGHGNNFASTWGEKAKSVFRDFAPIVLDENMEPLGLHLDPKRQARDNWGIAGTEGGMLTAGVGGPITGRGANLFVIDDAVKNAEEARSVTYREKIWDWFISTAYSRLEPNAAMIIMMTRWHEDDLVGRLLAGQEMELGETWDVVNFPAIAEKDEYLQSGTLFRKSGEALFPERYPIEQLETMRKQIVEWHGPYWWSALYQQRPAPVEGAMFRREWLRYFEFDRRNGVFVLEKPDGSKKKWKVQDCWNITTVDPAFTEKEMNDPTCVQTWAVSPDYDMLLLEDQVLRVEGPELQPILRSVRNRLKPRHIYVESVSGQMQIIQYAVRQGLPVMPIPADRDKISRAMPLQARMQAGAVYFLRGAAWLEGLERELLTFPNAKHDDQVDAAAYAAIAISQRGGKIQTIGSLLK